jgi:hypothetical protein
MGSAPPADRIAATGRTGAVVTAKMKHLERDRDSGAIRSSGRTTLVGYPAEWILRKETLRAVRRNTIDAYATTRSTSLRRSGRFGSTGSVRTTSIIFGHTESSVD